MCAAWGCGSTVDGDEMELELGQSEKAVMSATSPSFLAGYDASTLTQCRFSPASSSCRLPGRGVIRYTFQGDDFCSAAAGDARVSWQFLVNRALTNDIPSSINAAGRGNIFTAVRDDVNPSVKFVRGTCNGTAFDPTMQSFVCAADVFPIVTLLESLPGTYLRTDGIKVVKIDVDKVWDRALGPSFPKTVCAPGGDKTFNLHELLEHASEIAGLLPFGSGMYPGVVSADNQTEAWSSPRVEGIAGYQVSGFMPGQACRMGSYRLDMATGQYNTSGTCAD